MATKRICDLCGGDLRIIKHKEAYDTLASWFDFFKAKIPTTIKKISYFNCLSFVRSPFISPFSYDDIEICSNCFEDFKEFVLRKKAYINK